MQNEETTWKMGKSKCFLKKSFSNQMNMTTKKDLMEKLMILRLKKKQKQKTNTVTDADPKKSFLGNT